MAFLAKARKQSRAAKTKSHGVIPDGDARAQTAAAGSGAYDHGGG
jgi:hypothetical protein